MSIEAARGTAVFYVKSEVLTSSSILLSISKSTQPFPLWVWWGVCTINMEHFIQAKSISTLAAG
jgi:hypothetical protein